MNDTKKLRESARAARRVFAAAIRAIAPKGNNK
jgi:hypothetical protein